MDLVRASQQDPSKFEALYKKCADKIFNYFWYRTGHDKELSEDLMQETFIRAFGSLARFRDEGYSYLTYLRTIAHNVLVSHYRKKTSHPVDALPTEDVPHEIADDIIRKSEAESLWRAIQSLPAKNRDILLMFYQDDLPTREIASVMGSSDNAVKLNLSRTRKLLSKHPYLQDVAGYGHHKRKYTAPRFRKNGT